ncbi:hypothetical protein TVAG_190240 [Trichomonas vaginalis G3]|uniref:Tubby C-terminal domain-containing protein n=1 Tax=Trichomonas vaginalis (strain ATCC PRA-98 / G3) TaxID=412133 RepID=A2DKF3_TRIV3|nr:tubby protein, chain A domain-containing protein [Trichomonas vaginalis G3]EAY19130.1 hypothetical protein TVAG_190240 [Trichomonas vaginalis G3]KAI5490427.1 tubby protein, chain A domain-containing protein [Trichomonas vaginalis G3]|eukprot:XP_001580116.1 hypothetical protein [Trichomonas vaginalis G3]
MKNTITTVPYLSDENAQFRMDFVFFDTALSTSEIKPLHLSLPGKQNLKKTLNPRQTMSRSDKVDNNKASPNQTLRNGNHSPRPTATERQQEPVFVNQVTPNQPQESQPQPNQMNTFKMKRTLQNTLLQRTHSRNSQNMEQQDSPDRQQQPQQSSKYPRPQDSPPHSPNREQQQQRQVQQPVPRRSPVPEPAARQANPMAELGLDFSLTGLYLLPCLTSQTINMIFNVEEPQPNVTRYSLRMPQDVDTEIRLRCDVSGKSRTSKIELYYNDVVVGEFKYNSNNKCFSVGLTALTPAMEACAVLFNPSFSSSSAPRIFDFVIPALKKIDGRNQMFRVPYQEPSTLIQYVSKMAKESIRLKTRIPSNEGNEYDSTFKGKFLLNAPTNFILYHESNQKRDICTFSMVTENSYNLAVSYPLSPIQAFLAAVAASIPL